MRATKSTGETFGTVSRVAAFIRLMAERGEITLKEVSSELSLAPSTCYYILDLLCQEGLVNRLEKGRGYCIGAELFRMAAQVHAKHDIRLTARKFMQEIVAACDETCVLGVYMPSERSMMFADKIDSSRMLRYNPMMHVPLSVLWGASGRAILAYLPKDEVDRIFAGEGKSPGSGEPRPTRQKLERELAQVREAGFAVSRGQKIAGAVGVSAPIFGSSGSVVGSLSVTVPDTRMTTKYRSMIGKLVAAQGRHLSKALGATSRMTVVERTVA
jgi:DNA-binding IclR family transcriptional regulator